ncbi:thioredoxin family protein [Endozoicomonas sp. G2_1]|uniref:protein-disulfide reductase DsbD family protein n=1 Tax=Endozoicomonas sp. G2_1 TaxID=2821091 RepID=UPI001ADCBE5E|nr:protein-disulfide reductase DsbD domain-containing protein [Endozoicomonas sp. G2_1]MBO9488822.1 thioredoxin family protein [Endozoicomonas sp. G2_1]
MTTAIVRVISLLLLLSFCTVAAGNQHSASGPHIRVSLLSEHQSLVVGQQQWLGIRLSPELEWHTYWRNAGDSGEAPNVSWQTNADINFGEIQWPLPEQIPVAHLVNYGYSGDILLMVPITLNSIDTLNATTENATTARISAELSWLVCKEDCIPGWATLTIELPISVTNHTSVDAGLFQQTRKRLPAPQKLNGKYEITEQFLTLSVEPPHSANWQLMPLRADLVQHNQKQQWLADNNSNSANVLLAKSDYFSVVDEPLEFLMTDGNNGYYLTAHYNQSPSVTNSAYKPPIWLLLAFAFIGGLILNIMPCVLPVLSLKAMALAHHANNEHDSNRSLSHWGYLLGILASFWLFAGLILVLKSGGNAIGWGFHLQEPAVIAALAFLFVFIALMLWDIAPSGAGFANLGNKLTEGVGFSSQFFTGVLAVIVASPCTAPFMATALGVAMVSPALDTLLIFTALALGFALPLSLLSLSPQFAKALPKPGPWMETFKQFIAFPMLATVVWLVWVFLGQTNSLAQLILLCGLLLFTLLIWFAHKSRGKKSLIALILAVITAIYISVSANNKVNENATNQQLPSARAKQNSQPYDPTLLSELRNQQQVVIVNMTADWCITCKVNEHVAFKDPQLNQLLQQSDVHYLVGDWTNKNNTILQYLNQYQRSGVPLYVVYAGSKSARILPQILTPEIVINAIKQAQQELNHANK